MKQVIKFLDDLEAGNYSKEQILSLIALRGQDQQDLFARARSVRERHLGSCVTLRGVIEISNFCQKGCEYCAMRAQNKSLARYRETVDDIVGAAEKIKAAGVGVAFMQAGQDPKMDGLVEEALRRLRGMGMELLLNLGEKTPEQYRRWAEAGAGSYILKFESSNPDIYHSVTHSQLASREASARAIRAAGMRLGTGNIVGLPGQTREQLADDILYAIELRPDFVSSAPFIANQNTPLEHLGYGDVDDTLNTMAIWRVALKTCLIPAVSALEKIRKDGQLMGLNAGANVMTINFTPERDRKNYRIYNEERFVVSLQHARNTIARAGLTTREPHYAPAAAAKSAIRGAAIYTGVALFASFMLALSGMPGSTPARAQGVGDLLSKEHLLELISRKDSVLHVGGRDTFNVTPEGRAAGTALYNALEQHDVKLAKAASDIWDDIVPRENYGGEYTTLQWFAWYYMANDEKKKEMVADPYIRFFYDYLAKDDYSGLKEFLKRKYHAADIGDEETYDGQQRKIFLEDLINFGNPRREEWEHTTAFIKLIDPKPGDSIADIGTGPGYYAFKLAKQVGDSGKIYAIDSEEPHIKYLNAVKAALNVNNLQAVRSDGRTIGVIEQKVDKVVMCSMYHNVYAMTNRDDRETLLNAIKDALKDGGHLYLFDNAFVPEGELPYHGPFIAKELVVSQLQQYGFTLESYSQPIRQRYALVFRYDAPAEKQNASIEEKPAAEKEKK